MFLLIRNILPLNKNGFGKPVELVKEAIAEIIGSDGGKELNDITVVVVPVGRPQDPHSSSAYMNWPRKSNHLTLSLGLIS